MPRQEFSANTTSARIEKPLFLVHKEDFSWVPSILAEIDQADLEESQDNLGPHSRQTSVLVGALATFLGYSSVEIALMRASGHLHDMGKLDPRIPTAILLKPGPLTLEEAALIEPHAAFGADRIAKHSPSVAAIIRGHHDRVGNDPHLLEMQNMLSLADQTDALLSDRCYDKAKTPEVAREMLLGQNFPEILVDFTMQVRLSMNREQGVSYPLILPARAQIFVAENYDIAVKAA